MCANGGNRRSADPDVYATEGAQAADDAPVTVHVLRTPIACDHEFTQTGTDSDHCVKCKISVLRYAFMECP